MLIVMAGSSGYMGQELTRRLRAAGHDVVRLVRRPPAARDERQWDPAVGMLGHEVVDEADVVVNLCGSRLLGIPYKFSDTKATIRRHPPLLGEHNVEVRSEYA